MKLYHKVKNIRFFDNKLFISIDGIDLSLTVNMFSKKLLNASEMERNNFIISPSGYGINWPLLDEDISIDGLLKLTRKPTSHQKKKVIS